MLMPNTGLDSSWYSTYNFASPSTDRSDSTRCFQSARSNDAAATSGLAKARNASARLAQTDREKILITCVPLFPKAGQDSTAGPGTHAAPRPDSLANRTRPGPQGWQIHPRHGVAPARQQCSAFRLIEARFEASIASPQIAELIQAAVHTDTAAGKVGRAQGRCLHDLGPVHGNCQNVCKKLHHPVVTDHATVYAQRGAGDPVACHCVQQVAGLVAHGFKRGTGELGRTRRAGQSEQRAACIRVPEWRP